MTECAKCGDCCERISFTGNWSYLQEWLDWWDKHCAWAMANLRDGEDGGHSLDEQEQRTLANARFLAVHWRPAPGYTRDAMPLFACDAFDPVTRLCTAHDARPPICRDFPWYGRPDRSPRFGPRCSFWADVPLGQRPGAGLKLLPVLQ